MEKLLLTPEEAAARLNVGRTKMYELLRGRVIDSIKIDGLRRVRPEALEAFIARLAANAVTVDAD